MVPAAAPFPDFPRRGYAHGMLIGCKNIAKGHDNRTLFHDLSFSVEDGERVGLIGPNGVGKSTLLTLLAGLDEPDEGEIVRRRGLRAAYLPQIEKFPVGASARDVLIRAASGHLHEAHDQATAADILLTKLEFPDPDRPNEALSGGWRKRLAIAAALITEPDLLLLDEPTNHLDLEGILWLEDLLRGTNMTFVLCSHDRTLLERVVQRVLELNPAYAGGCYSVDGTYSRFLEKRTQTLEGQQSSEAALASRLRDEIAWLKRGRKAQRIQAKFRLDQIDDMSAELGDLRDRNRSERINIDFDATGRKTRKLLAAHNVSKSLGGRKLFGDVTLVLSPGTRLGLLGRNGAGKSTLIKVLSGELPPDTGTVKYADDLRLVVFDQQRLALPKEQTLRTALAGPTDTVVYRERPIHVASWAERFLFRKDQLNAQVGDLSGGEQARVQLARMMTQPADVLILDEPTNDLDIDTLEMLEESLEGFPGAIILVTHDRLMLDRLCEEILALHGDGEVTRYGEVAQWETARRDRLKPSPAKPATKAADAPPEREARRKPKKLSFNEQKEYDGMEAAIAKAEGEVKACEAAVNDPAVATDHVELTKRCETLATAQRRVEQLYARWQELEDKRAELEQA